MPRETPRALVNQAGELLLYGVIGDDWDRLDAASVIQAVLELGDIEALTIRINSPGGFVFEGLAIFNFLRSLSAKKTVVIDGLAASMASVIAMVGDEIVMPANTFMMIHNPWNVVIGDADDMRKEAATLDKIKTSIVAIYAERTGKSADELSAMMDVETWMNGEEAVAEGFATKTAETAADAAALADLDIGILTIGNLDKIPAPLRAVPNRAASRARALAPRGAAQPKESTMTLPAPAAEPPVNTPAADAAAAQQIAQQAVAQERTRCSEIRRAVRAANLGDELSETLINEGIGIDQARARIIDTLAASDAAAPTRSAISITADAVDKFRAGAQVALLARANLGTIDAGNEFRGLTLRELARECLTLRGLSSRGLGSMEMVKMAMTHSTSDFPIILANVAEKSMMRGYEEAEETFQQWTAAGTLSDFKVANRIDLNLFPSLRKVPEGAEYKYATIGERGEQVQLATYGELFSITRQAIINDDMNVFTRVPLRMGRAAIRTVGNLAYAVLTDNPNMSDGVALFHANHKNLAAAGGAPSVTTVDAARVAMATQKDRDAKAAALNIRPAYALVPVALEGTFKVLMASEFDPSKTQRTPNSVAGLVTPISDARLDAASATAWYLAANQNSTDTIEVSYLDGVTTPVLEQMEGWKVDGLEFKVRIDAAVKALAWEGLYKNPG